MTRLCTKTVEWLSSFARKGLSGKPGINMLNVTRVVIAERGLSSKTGIELLTVAGTGLKLFIGILRWILIGEGGSIVVDLFNVVIFPLAIGISSAVIISCVVTVHAVLNFI